MFQSKAFKTKEVAASLSGNAVIVKKISLPVMTASELDESIYWEAEQYIPFDIQDVNLDYQILDAGDGHDRKGTMEVLLVAAKKEKIADYTGVIAQAGRTPVVVDVDAFALQNAYELNYGFEPGTVVVLLNAGASAININIVANEQSVFTRDVSLGGNAYTEAVQRELNLPFESAELMKKGMPVDGATFEDVLPVLRAMTENVMLSAEDIRLLQGDSVDRSHRPHHAQRRRLASRGVCRGDPGTVRHAGRDVRSVPQGHARQQEVLTRAARNDRAHGRGRCRTRIETGR